MECQGINYYFHITAHKSAKFQMCGAGARRFVYWLIIRLLYTVAKSTLLCAGLPTSSACLSTRSRSPPRECVCACDGLCVAVKINNLHTQTAGRRGLCPMTANGAAFVSMCVVPERKKEHLGQHILS